MRSLELSLTPEVVPMIAAVVIAANLLTDIAYCLIDPRIAYR